MGLDHNTFIIFPLRNNERIAALNHSIRDASFLKTLVPQFIHDTFLLLIFLAFLSLICTYLDLLNEYFSDFPLLGIAYRNFTKRNYIHICKMQRKAIMWNYNTLIAE